MKWEKKMSEHEKRLARNTFFLYLMQISSYVFPLLTFPYLTRVLGAEKYGVVVFSNAVMQYFTLFIEFGFILSATNLCSQFRHDREKLGNITFGVMYAKIFLAIVTGLVLIILCIYVENFKANFLYFFLSYVGVFLTIFLPDFLFRGIEEMSVLTYRVIFSKLIYTITIFLFIHKPQDYIFVPLATVGANVTAVLLTWYEIKKKGYISKVRVSRKEILVYLKESGTFFLSRVAVSMYTTLNTVLLGFKFSEAAMGQYGAANSLISTGRSFISPISDSMYPYLVKNKNYKLVKKVLLIIEPIIILGCIVLFFLAKPIIRIICGEGYSDAVPILRAMLPLVVISLPTYLFGYPVLGALGKVNIANISVMIGSIFHITGLGVMYVLNMVNFISISLLTFITEVIVFGIRGCSILKRLREVQVLRELENKNEKI